MRHAHRTPHSVKLYYFSNVLAFTTTVIVNCRFIHEKLHVLQCTATLTARPDQDVGSGNNR